MEIRETQKKIYDNNVAKGFWPDEGRNVGEMLMLVVTELSEALEVHRKKKSDESLLVPTYKFETANDLLNADLGDGTYQNFFERHIKDSWGDELADAVIRLFDVAEGTGVDLTDHIKAKMEYNSRRPHKHGKAY